MRVGDVTQAVFGSRINWIYNPAPPPPRRATLHSRDSHVSIPSDKRKNEAPDIATRRSREAPLTPPLPQKHRKRRRRNAQRAANRNSAASSRIPVTPDARWANQRTAVPAGVTQPLPENSDPTSARRTAVYPPSQNVGDSLANENSPVQIGLESSRIPDLYKPAVPDQQQDTQARTLQSEQLRIRHLLTPLLVTLHQTLLRTTRWVINDKSYTRAWGNTKVRVWNCLPAAATRPSSRHPC